MIAPLRILIAIAVLSLVATAAPVGICLHAYSPEAPSEKIECFEFEKVERAAADYRFFPQSDRSVMVTAYRFRGTIPYKPELTPTHPEFDKLLKLYEETARATPSTRPYLNPKILAMRGQADGVTKQIEKVAKLPDIALDDGTVLKGCKVSKLDGSLVSIVHADGIKNIRIFELSKESKDALNLTTTPTAMGSPSLDRVNGSAQTPGEAPRVDADLNPGKATQAKTSDDLSEKIAGLRDIPLNDAGSVSDTETVATQQNSSEDVMAEGVGKDEKSALKDAFRNAVEQVVGMVVDSTVQSKNDEIIRDQILTASDGFIKEFKMISSETQADLVCVRIKAVVERKSLVKKLEAQQVIVKKLDMGNLFAKVASDDQAVQGATGILKERLLDMQKAWTVKAGEPNYDRTKKTLSIPLFLAADEAAYSASVSRLVSVLEKVRIREKRQVFGSTPSESKVELLSSGARQIEFVCQRHELETEVPSFLEKRYASTPVWLSPDDYAGIPDSAFWMWVCVSEKKGVSEWRGFAIDAEINELGPLLIPTWSIVMELRDEENTVLGTFEADGSILMSAYHHGGWSCDPTDDSQGDEFSQIGAHIHQIEMANSSRRAGKRECINMKNSWVENIEQNREKARKFQCLLGPMVLSVSSIFSAGSPESGQLHYWKKFELTATFKISPDTINDIKKTEISISARPRKIENK